MFVYVVHAVLWKMKLYFDMKAYRETVPSSAGIRVSAVIVYAS